MKLEKTDDSVVKISIDDSDRISIIWMADAHIDSVDTYRAKIKKIFDSNPDSYIIVGSDFSDMMQNFGDKRASKGKDRYNVPDYINAICSDLIEFFSPYAHRIISFNLGNHELNAVKFHGINIAQWIATNINQKCGTNIQTNDFAGYFILAMQPNIGENNKSKRVGYVHYQIYYSHRPISGGSRSKGVLSADIVSGRYPGADMYIHEHIHQSLLHPFSVEELNTRHLRVKKNKWFVVMPTMKEEDQGAMNSHHYQRNYSPTFIGMMRLNFAIKHTPYHRIDCNPIYLTAL